MRLRGVVPSARLALAFIAVLLAVGFGGATDHAFANLTGRGDQPLLESPPIQSPDPQGDLATSVISKLAEHPVEHVRTKLTITWSAGQYRIAAVSAVHVANSDPAADTLLDGTLSASGMSDLIFGEVSLSSQLENDLSSQLENDLLPPDDESVAITDDTVGVSATRTEVWSIASDDIQPVYWNSADSVQDYFGNENVGPDTSLVDVDIVGARLFALNGISSADALQTHPSGDVEATVDRGGQSQFELDVIADSTSTANMSVTSWPCYSLSLLGCISGITPDMTGEAAYDPNAATEILKLFLAALTMLPMLLALGRGRPVAMLWTGWRPLLFGGASAFAGVIISYLANVFYGIRLWGELSTLTTLLWFVGIGLTICLYMKFGESWRIRIGIAVASMFALLGDVAYTYVAYFVNLEYSVFLICFAAGVFASAALILRSYASSIVAVGVAVSLNLQFNGWLDPSGNRPESLLDRLPSAVENIQPAWLPVSIGLIAVATVRAYLVHVGARVHKIFPLFYAGAVALAVVPEEIIWPTGLYGRGQGLPGVIAPKLPWMAAVTVFVICALIRVSLLGRDPTCYARPATRRLAIAVTALCCMLILSPSYEAGPVAATAVGMLLFALPVRAIPEAVTLARSTIPDHVKAVHSYQRARTFLAANIELNRSAAEKLATGEIPVDVFLERSDALQKAVEAHGGVGDESRRKTFGILVEETPIRAGVAAAVLAFVISIPIVVFDLSGIPETFFESLSYTLPVSALWQAVGLERWVAYGFIFGFFFPLLRGITPTGKAARLALSVIPIELVLTWTAVPAQDGKGLSLGLAAAQTLAFFLVLGVVWEIRLVRRAGAVWSDVRLLRGSGTRALFAPASAILVAVLTAAATAFTTTEAPRIVPQQQPTPTASAAPSSGMATQPAASTQVPWPTGAETALPTVTPLPTTLPTTAQCATPLPALTPTPTSSPVAGPSPTADGCVSPLISVPQRPSTLASSAK